MKTVDSRIKAVDNDIVIEKRVKTCTKTDDIPSPTVFARPPMRPGHPGGSWSLLASLSPSRVCCHLQRGMDWNLVAC